MTEHHPFKWHHFVSSVEINGAYLEVEQWRLLSLDSALASHEPKKTLPA